MPIMRVAQQSLGVSDSDAMDVINVVAAKLVAPIAPKPARARAIAASRPPVAKSLRATKLAPKLASAAAIAPVGAGVRKRAPNQAALVGNHQRRLVRPVVRCDGVAPHPAQNRPCRA